MLIQSSNRSTAGFSFVELLIAVAITGIIMLALMGVINTATETGDSVTSTNDLTEQARFAMQRMVSNTSRTNRLLVPMRDRDLTNWPENIREQTIPASPPVGDSTFATAVLAITLPRDIDLDQDGVPDADNDGDGVFDEDLDNDMHFDAAAGIVGIDDDGDGTIDDGNSSDDDESGFDNEDPIDGIDEEGDGNIDEDPGSDMNGDGCPGICGVDDDGDGQIDEGNVGDDDEDGQVDEDFFNVVAYYLSGNVLVERLPVPWDEDAGGLISGLDFVITELAQNVTRFRVERVEGNHTNELVDLTLELTDPDSGETISLNTRVRVSGAH